MESFLKFFCKKLVNCNYNIVKYAKKKIETGDIEKAYIELIAIDQVGDKIAGCFLRDIIWIYNLENKCGLFKGIFPVDTWVEQVYRKMWEKKGRREDNASYN